MSVFFNNVPNISNCAYVSDMIVRKWVLNTYHAETKVEFVKCFSDMEILLPVFDGGETSTLT